ncbi:Hypothetical Protein FCC1311_068092 [Hondaea fermentalgiana]|uniref:SWIM-type domain-containing protein n=1 Tax=Hondaea fermentalgiana TaxID=2315210 RepID=A0A2R5GJU3_9STRA|nr:Hypothetical Protein FCC1311_068092 [Hondaea fermentalgiana]|eukprot:GBG30589.1 Hypothetical Protein FCC1311_068092 [Hondaea fermentalgiana]
MQAAQQLLAEAGARLLALDEADKAVAEARGTAEQDAAREARRKCEEKAFASALALDALVGPDLLDRALAVCKPKDRANAVRRFVARRSRRTCYHVCGVQSVYLCVEGFCSCRDFVSRAEAVDVPMCKHLVAAALADALGVSEEIIVNDEDFAKHLSSR